MNRMASWPSTQANAARSPSQLRIRARGDAAAGRRSSPRIPASGPRRGPTERAEQARRDSAEEAEFSPRAGRRARSKMECALPGFSPCHRISALGFGQNTHAFSVEPRTLSEKNLWSTVLIWTNSQELRENSKIGIGNRNDSV